MIIVTATFAQALAGSGPGVSIIGVLIVWRFIMGVGVGGDYPLSAVISSEFASTGTRGRLMTLVFTAQGWGNLGKQCLSLQGALWRSTSFGPSCVPRRVGNGQCVQARHHQRQLRRTRACGLLLALPHRPGLCARRDRAVFQAHYSRNAAFHDGHRSGRTAGEGRHRACTRSRGGHPCCLLG